MLQVLQYISIIFLIRAVIGNGTHTRNLLSISRHLHIHHQHPAMGIPTVSREMQVGQGSITEMTSMEGFLNYNNYYVFMVKRKRKVQIEDNRVYNSRGQDMAKKYPGMSLREQRMFSGGMY
jgi:hypothetical protein